MNTRRIPVEDYAAEAGMPTSELVIAIIDGNLPGERQGNRWYVAVPLVQLVRADSFGRDAALLKIAACRLGCYLTAGRGEVGIPLRFEDSGRPAALDALNLAMSTGVPPKLPVEVYLNGEYFMLDSSLWVDLGAALVEYAALFDTSMKEQL